jgi:signal transduction histidine kinase
MTRPPEHGLTPDHVRTLNRLATIARLLAGATHEVNNALQVIGGTVELLESRTDLPPQVVTGLARLRTQGDRAAAAIAAVTQFSRARPGGRERINLRELTDQCVALRLFAVRRGGLTLDHSAVTGHSLVVEGSSVELQQVVLNLIINAEQALAGTGGTIQVHVFDEADTVNVRVSDRGPGVRPDLGDDIFELLVSSRSPTESPGLGLTAARLIAIAHGGTLTREPTDVGASFLLRIPAAVRSGK